MKTTSKQAEKGSPMNNPFNTNYSYQLQYLRDIRRTCGEVFFTQANIADDQNRNTDIIIELPKNGGRVACRVRRPECYRYKDEFTIRCRSRFGAKTEIDKILEGWGDYVFYAFGGRNAKLRAWTIADLNVFRDWITSRIKARGGIQLPHIPNNDGTAFMAFKWEWFPPGFIVASETRETHHVTITDNNGQTVPVRY